MTSRAVADPHWLSINEIVTAYQERRLSPVELTAGLLARIERLDPQLNAFVHLDAEAALDAARVAEAEIVGGRSRGPLHGVPVGIKDIIDVATAPTTCQSRILLDNRASSDAVCVAKLRQAGAIIVGKLATHEFALGGPSFDLPFPPARNPWDRERHPGYSSSGSGAAVAAGFLPAALGTDTGGSIRNPASACGIVGLKPTYGRVSRRGVFPLAFSLDHVGPLTRTVADAALMLAAIEGADPFDPASVHAPPAPRRAQLERGVAGIRIGFVRHFHDADQTAHPDVSAALLDVGLTLSGEGAQVRDVTLPPLHEFAGVNRVILAAEAWTIHAPWLRARPGDYGRHARRRLLAGAFLTAGDYVQAQRRRRELIAAVEEVFRDVDVLVCASSMDPPCRIDDTAELARTAPRQARTPFNVTGHPALAMMSGQSADTGLPLSVQFVGRYFDEVTVLRVARAWERASGIATRRPPLP